MTPDKQPLSQSGMSGLVFVGCLFVGLAAGLLTGQVAVGILGGLGVGFIGIAVVRYLARQW